MKKKPKKAIAKVQEAPASMLEEPEVMYNRTIRVISSVNDFTYNEFKKIAEKTPFTQSEWAAMLHISERTLQRYAKNNSSFAPINAERFVQIIQVLNRAKKVFGTVDYFYNWIHSYPPMLEGALSFNSLTSQDGLQKILLQIGRIEQGILA